VSTTQPSVGPDRRADRVTPHSAGFAMPPEWFPHERTWMSFPPVDDYDADTPNHVVPMTQAWARAANAIVEFEPVSMLVPSHRQALATTLLDPRIEQVECDLDDAWFRDNGPTFLLDEQGALGAALWVFNGWGRAFAFSTDKDHAAGRTVAEHVDARTFTSTLVNEGGGIHVDGEGTIIVTESVQLDPLRNPTWTKADVESELSAMLGVSTVIWMRRGLAGDMDPDGYGTNGHIDVFAAFLRPGVVMVQYQPDPSHPDHDVTVEAIELLREATDARGRRLEVVTLEAPSHGWNADGSPSEHSYLNFVMANNGLVLCSFDDPIGDERCASTFARLFPERRIVQVPAAAVFARGGGLHCITQQQPARLPFTIPPV
jgi:agmatine deiminase